MDVSFTHSIENGYLHVVASARQVSPRTYLSYSCEIDSIAKANGITKILLDHRNMPTVLEPGKIVEILTEVTNKNPDILTYKFAVVYTPGHLVEGRFMHTAATNRRIRLKYFTEPEAAGAWLAAGD